MLLTNRRHRLLHVTVAAMEIGWIAPWTLLFIRFWQQRLDLPVLAEAGSLETIGALDNFLDASPLIFYSLLLGVMLVYMLAADLLNRWQIDWPQRELIMLALVLGTSLLLVRLLLYPTLGYTRWNWFVNTWRSVFDFSAGRRPELAILLINAFLWFRVAVNTDRDLGFFNIALSFRLGLLIAIVGNALLTGVAGYPFSAALLYFAFFLIAGLTAVAIARTDEKAYLMDSSRGALLPWSRLAQIVATTLAILMIGALAALVYTPGNIRTVIRWFSPVWDLLSAILVRVLFGVVWVLGPIMEWTINTLRRLMEQAQLDDELEPPSAGEMFNIDVTSTDITELLNRYIYVRYGLVLMMTAIVLGLIWLFFLRTRRHNMRDEGEEISAERMTFGGDLFGRGLDRLRNLAGLLRRYGVGSQLLAAISIQNIYANVNRLAGRRGFPRHRSQPPDDYLPVLFTVFPGFEDELGRITDAYMRVEYGDQALDNIELSSLREDFRSIQTAPLPEPTEAIGVE